MIVKDKIGPVTVEVGNPSKDAITFINKTNDSFFLNYAEWIQLKAVVEKGFNFLNQRSDTLKPN